MTLLLSCSLCIFLVLFCGELFREKYSLIPDTPMKVPPVIFAGFLIPLILTSTFRYGFIDTFAYKIMYQNACSWDYIDSSPWGVERGWLIFLHILNFFSKSPKLLFFLSALLINGSVVFLISRYSGDPILSLLLYFSFSYLDTNNGIRQFSAAAIVLFAMALLLRCKKKNWVLFFIAVAAAAQFHCTAWICLPIALAVSGKILNWKVLFAAATGILLCIFTEYISDFSGIFPGGFKYEHYIRMKNGMGLPRAIITGFLPLLLLGFYFFRTGKAENPPPEESAMLFNLLFLNSVFSLMGMQMQYWARLQFYTAFSLYVFLPELTAASLGNNRRNRIARIITVFCALIFFGVNLCKNWSYGTLEDFYWDTGL